MARMQCIINYLHSLNKVTFDDTDDDSFVYWLRYVVVAGNAILWEHDRRHRLDEVLQHKINLAF